MKGKIIKDTLSPQELRPESRPYEPHGAALDLWKTRAPDVLLAGPADTGKSRAILEKLHYCAQKYDHARILIVRKSRESITHSVMVTYEQKVLPEDWLGKTIHFRTVEQQYVYPNKSIIAVGGMDKPTKVLSSEWDIIYASEATELDENDWEILSSRLRNGRMPYQQMVGDCNPSHPRHWLKARCDRGSTRMLTSRHEDNPSITQERLDRLKALTGVRYQRYYLGQWAAAEGLVYEEWDDRLHTVSMPQMKKMGVYKNGEINPDVIHRVIAGVDFGWTNPAVIHVYGLDTDDRLYLFEEVYMTHKTDDWLIEQAQTLDEKYGVELWICDPSSPASIEKFRAKGLPAIKAENAISSGIDSVKSRLEVQGDGSPRLFIYDRALREPDQEREAAHQPNGLLAEVMEYTWAQSREGFPPKEVPNKLNDHACFIAGTKIYTIDGTKNIEDIRIGDAVLTSEGYKPVTIAGLTKRDAECYSLYCEDGTVLTGTGNHPIWTENRGYVSLAELKDSDTLSRCDNGIDFPLFVIHREYERADVYNLDVDFPHNYYANGILVSNCDALRYVCKYLDVPRVPMQDDNKKKPLKEIEYALEEITLPDVNTIDPFAWSDEHGVWNNG